MEALNNEIDLLRLLKRQIHELRMYFDKIEEDAIREDLKQIILISDKIYLEVAKDAEKLNKSRNFIRFYLGTVVKVVNRYINLKATKLTGSDAQKLYIQVESFLPRVNEAFNKIYSSLFTAEIMDIDTEIRVMLKEMGMK